MSEEFNEIAGSNTDKNTNKNAEKTADNKSDRQKLLDAHALLHTVDRSPSVDVKKIADESEREREKRAIDAKARIAENTERAQRAAEEKAAIIESSGEYRQKLAARENKRAQEEKKKREELEREQERQRAEERRIEIEEYRRAEREKNEGFAARSELIMSKITGNTSGADVLIETTDDSGVEKPESVDMQETELCLCEAESENTESEDSTENEINEISSEACCADENLSEECYATYIEEKGGSDIESNTGDTDAAYDACGKTGVAEEEYSTPVSSDDSVTENLSDNSDGDGKVIISIGDKCEDDGFIHIGGRSYPEIYPQHLQGAPNMYSPNTAVAGAVAGAVYGEELRRLREEEARYAAEISEIRAKRREYAELLGDTAAADIYSEGFLSDLQQTRISDEEIVRAREAASVGVQSSNTKIISEYDKYQEKLHRERKTETLIDENTVLADEPITNQESVIEETEIGQQTAIAVPGDSSELIKANEEHETEEGVSAGNHAKSSDTFAKSELAKKLDDFYKAESELVKKRDKLSKIPRKASPEEKTTLAVKKISVQKELCELAAEALGACVYVGARARTKKHKKILEAHIEMYNAFCDEYEALSGRALERIDGEMVQDVLDGKLYQPISNVYYHGMEEDVVRSGITEESEREHRIELEEELIKSEFDRLNDEPPVYELTKKEKKAAAKRRSERMSTIRRATERDLLVVSLRSEYLLAELEARRDLLRNSYGNEKRGRAREIRQIEKRIDKIRNEEKRTLKFEREDNSRYYLLSALEPSKEKVKKKARRERLESLRLRLDVLLSERESINERLIALYGGSDNGLRSAKVNRKAGAVRRKTAKEVHKSQKKLAARIERYKAPVDMKERAYDLLNEKTVQAATLEEKRYKLHHMKLEGRARRELVMEIRRGKKAIRRADREIAYMLKKLKRQEERYRSSRDWAVFLVTLALLAVAGIIVWTVFGDSIMAYINELIGYFA